MTLGSEPDDYWCAGFQAVQNDLAEVHVVGRAELILDDYLATAVIDRQYVGPERSYLCFALHQCQVHPKLLAKIAQMGDHPGR